MGEWLIGIYKGRMMAAREDERKHIWRQSIAIRNTGLFRTSSERIKLKPYFYGLSKVADFKCRGDRGAIQERYGLDSLAYRYSGLRLEAFGETGRRKDGTPAFFLDKGVVSRCIAGMHELLQGGKAMGPGQKDLRNSLVEKLKARGLAAPSKEDTFNALKEMFEDRPFVLALNTEKLETAYTDVFGKETIRQVKHETRTGTFFKFFEEGGRIGFSSCTHGGKCLVGKGILLGIHPNPSTGTMDAEEAEREWHSPVSRLCAKFRYCKYGNRDFYIIYREASTDLRADMPLAMLNANLADKASFETMFRTLGKCASSRISKKRLYLLGRNVLLDGVIVDYADPEEDVDLDDPAELELLQNMRQELRAMIYAAAMISAMGEKALKELAVGPEGLTERLFPSSFAILRRYDHYLECFAEGAGKNMRYFSELYWRDGHFPLKQ